MVFARLWDVSCHWKQPMASQSRIVGIRTGQSRSIWEIPWKAWERRGNSDWASFWYNFRSSPGCCCFLSYRAWTKYDRNGSISGNGPGTFREFRSSVVWFHSGGRQGVVGLQIIEIGSETAKIEPFPGIPGIGPETAREFRSSVVWFHSGGRQGHVGL